MKKRLAMLATVVLAGGMPWAGIGGTLTIHSTGQNDVALYGGHIDFTTTAYPKGLAYWGIDGDGFGIATQDCSAVIYHLDGQTRTFNTTSIDLSRYTSYKKLEWSCRVTRKKHEHIITNAIKTQLTVTDTTAKGNPYYLWLRRGDQIVEQSGIIDVYGHPQTTPEVLGYDSTQWSGTVRYPESITGSRGSVASLLTSECLTGNCASTSVRVECQGDICDKTSLSHNGQPSPWGAQSSFKWGDYMQISLDGSETGVHNGLINIRIDTL